MTDLKDAVNRLCGGYNNLILKADVRLDIGSVVSPTTDLRKIDIGVNVSASIKNAKFFSSFLVQSLSLK